MLAAISSVSDTELAASPVKLLVATDSAQVELLDSATEFGARVVHLSPGAGAVEVLATSTALPGTTTLINSFSYTDIVPAGGSSYVGLPAGDYVFNVGPVGAGLPGITRRRAWRSILAMNTASLQLAWWVAVRISRCFRRSMKTVPL